MVCFYSRYCSPSCEIYAQKTESIGHILPSHVNHAEIASILDFVRTSIPSSLLFGTKTQFAKCTHMAFHEWQSNQPKKVKEKIKLLKSSLAKKAWWNSVMDAYHVMMLVMYAIRNLDQRAPNLGKVWMQ